MDDLKVESLSCRIADFELSADFHVRAGERVAVQGRSGGGKSSLLRALAGLMPLKGGKVLLGTTDISSLPPEKRETGFVFQDPTLFGQLSVAENAGFGLRMRGVPTRKRREEVLPWLERVGLAKHADQSVGKLSGGEKSRLAFVRALIWKPKLVLLDEPFTALDPALRASLQGTLLEMHSQWPVPLLIVTHDEADARAIATATLKLEEDDSRKRRRFIRV
jgi:ABC-type Fe3+/spermidine/putrescine transport system ATPase subunit